jgi:vacuolar-type H+-ATPase subunit D/Vma8
MTITDTIRGNTNMADLDDLKRKRDQLTAKIQQAEARQRATTKKAEDRVKILVGSAVLHQQKKHTDKQEALLALLDSFLTRPAERVAVLGKDGQGSDIFKKMMSHT